MDNDRVTSMDGEDVVLYPFLGDYDSVARYTRDRRRFLRYMHECCDYPDHHLQDYPVVTPCPDCGKSATVISMSSTDDPLWRCREGDHSFEESKFRGADLGIQPVQETVEN